MTVYYPDEFALKIISHEAYGGKPDNILLTIPTITHPNIPFRLKVAVVDKNGFPCMNFDERLLIKSSEAGISCINIKFESQKAAIAYADDIVIGENGFYRFQTEFDGKTYYSNPTFCTHNSHYGIYWGDPHVHTILSRCHTDKCRTLNFCYTAGKYLSGLDWIAAADHVSNDRCDESKWKEQSIVSNLYNEPGRFVTIPAYEASHKGGAGGDNNVYMDKYSEIYIDEHDNGTIKTLVEKLVKQKSQSDTSFFVVPHHTTRTGKHGEINDAIYPGEAAMPVIEIHSKWGTSEYRDNPNALKDIHDGPSYAVDLLNRGIKLGFIGGTDTHSTMTYAKNIEPDHIDRLPGLTAVCSDQLTRSSIFNSIKNRKCYAASLERIYLDVIIDGAGHGETLEKSLSEKETMISVSAATQSDIVSVEIIRNGQVIYRHEPHDWKTTFDYTDRDNIPDIMKESVYLDKFIYYYVRICCVSGAQAWSSPVWLQLK